MGEMFEVMAESFEVNEFFSSLLSAAITIYGITFLFNLACLFIINKRFLYLLNIQIGDNYVMSSSSAFNDNKGILPANAGLMLLIPFYYNFYVIHYALILKKTFPKARVNMVMYWILSVGVSVVALIATTFLIYAVKVGDETEVTVYIALQFLPAVILMAALLLCYLVMYGTLKRNFSPNRIKED